MPKKILSVALAAAYLTVGACRFACAATMPAAQPLAAVRNAEQPACPHHAQQAKGGDHGRRHPGPCCIAQAEGAAALLPSQPALSRRILVSELACETPALPALAPLLSFTASHDPPWLTNQVLDSSSSRSSRAPPSLLAVL